MRQTDADARLRISVAFHALGYKIEAAYGHPCFSLTPRGALLMN